MAYRFKRGVDFRRLSGQTVLALVVAHDLNPKQEMWVTSIADSDPDRVSKSKHVVGDAFDIRTRGYTKQEIESWASLLQNTLDTGLINGKRQYDVVVESDHIHVEFDPAPYRDS